MLGWAGQVSELHRPDFRIEYVPICKDMPVINSNDILLLIISFQVRGIPHFRYRGSVGFVYSIGPGFPGSCDYIRSLPVGLELSCCRVRCVLKNSSQDEIARLEHPRPYSFVIKTC